jgi:hypothetical protein
LPDVGQLASGLKTEEDMAKVRRKTPALIVALMLAIAGTVLVIGPAVQAANTDVSISDYSQCTDGTADDNFKACTGWINGILNAQNSTYHEDEVTPQRLLLKVPKGATLGHSLDITYLTRKGSAQAHAYDSLATWNYTQTAADRCQSLQNCPSGTSPSAVVPIPSDPTDVPPATTHSGDASTDLRELPQANRELQWFGPVAATTAPGPITHNAAANASSDDYATLTVNYTLNAAVVDTNNDQKVDATTYVQLVFGGHLAASVGSRGWGAGLGASNINGGPYHIRITKIDATAIGNRDNQITSGAILPQQTSVTTELHQTTDSTGTTDVGTPGLTINATLPAGGGTVFVKDVATVNPSDATGTVSFRYYTSETACSGDTTGTGGVDAGANKSLSGGSATSDVKSFTSAGTFYWRAFFTATGISVSSSSLCNEVLTITQNTSTSTELHETDGTGTGTDVDPANNQGNGTGITVSVGANVTDYATVTPATATGSVAFRYYSGADALTDCASDVTDFGNGTAPSLGTDAGGGTVTGGTATSTEQSFSSAGTFYWMAFFTGTDPNNDSVSSCSGEVLTVQKGAPTLATSPTLTPQDSATLSGISAGGSPQATITFELFGPGDATCSGTAEYSTTMDVTGDGTYTTNNTTFVIDSSSTFGTYRWKVTYSGDSKNEGNSKACGVEQFTVTDVTAASAS